ncbi:hypothetical protein JOQ06_008404 [Pogonophryne albipinna]|uniref:Fibronectin type-III domain-containing protein n=1 Tax=Pogonophryne albipinna TaxID=1090488 RepID=A0AAD6AK99_9TELE|nr:hypothetical protein JOQ06_008404 [Pogonophryne albipinna]
MPSEGRCSQKVEKVGVGERNWRLTAQNEFGKAELSDTADLSKRVHMFAPNGVKALTVNARSVILQWDWTVQLYNILNITCQIENVGVGLNCAALNDLIPNWTYNVTVRCGTAQYFWKWSDWSKKVLFQTYGDVPDALDVWMQMEGNQIKIIWKTERAARRFKERLRRDRGNVITLYSLDSSRRPTRPLRLSQTAKKSQELFGTDLRCQILPNNYHTFARKEPLESKMTQAKLSHGLIKGYEVIWRKTTEKQQHHRTNLAFNKQSFSLSLNSTKEYIVTVTARNINGSSTPSTITIPSLNPGMKITELQIS